MRPRHAAPLGHETTQESSGATAARPTHSADEQVGRHAKLIAIGEFPFPTDIDSVAAGQLAARVRELRRDRLVSFIATAIALDINRTRLNEGDPTDAET